jgi:uroporphyrinogen-III synthase
MSQPMSRGDAPLRGRRVVTTRDDPGELDRLLAESGADVVHVPLIEIADPLDGGAELQAAPHRLDDGDWVVVTSHHGAARVGEALADHPQVRTAAVGTRTANVIERLAGRPVDVRPSRQTAADLLEAMPPDGHGQVVVVAHADRADPALAVGLSALGYRVRPLVAYRTLTRTPSAEERAAAVGADAVAFASGSAARAWHDAVGTETPSVVVAIGPTTAGAARACGLDVTHVAEEHSVEGLVQTVIEALAPS